MDSESFIEMVLRNARLRSLSGTVMATYRKELEATLKDPQRLTALYGSTLFTQPPRERLQVLVQAASTLLDASHSEINLLSDKEQITVASWGGEARRGPIEDSYCQNMLMTQAPLMIEDASDHSMVCVTKTAQAGLVVSYLGVPLVREGYIVGTLCVWDEYPRNWGKRDVEALTKVASIVGLT